jgi:hypothetical protein
MPWCGRLLRRSGALWSQGRLALRPAVRGRFASDSRSGLLAAAQAGFDVVDARHQIGDRVHDVVGARLQHAPVGAIALHLLLGRRQRLPVGEL